MDDVWATDGGIYLGYACDNTQGEPLNVQPTPTQYVGDRHIITIGPNGSGKSRRLLLPNLIGLPHWSMLVIDPKGELAWWTADYRRRFGEVLFLNPYGELGLPCQGFNPVASLDPTVDNFVDDALGLAEAMIRIEGHEPHWSASAQDLLCACIMYSRLLRETRGSLRHVRELVGQSSLDLRKTVKHMRELGGERDWDELTIKASRFLDIDPENKELNSILSTAMTQTRWLDSRAIKANTDVGSFDFAAMKERPVTVYLILPANRLATQSPWLRLIITCVLQRLMLDVRAPKVPVLLMLDEFAQLGHLPIIENTLAMMRGYGIKLWSVLQDINQATAIYRDRWESFIANAGVLQAFAPQDMTTAEFLSRRTGQKTEPMMSYGSNLDRQTGRPTSESLNINPVPLPTMLPQDIINMDMGYSVLFTHKTKGTVRSFMPDPSEMDAFRPFARRMPENAP